MMSFPRMWESSGTMQMLGFLLPAFARTSFAELAPYLNTGNDNFLFSFTIVWRSRNLQVALFHLNL